MAQPVGLSETQRRDEEQDNLVGGPGPGHGSARGNGAAGNAVTWQISLESRAITVREGVEIRWRMWVRVETCSFRKGLTRQ